MQSLSQIETCCGDCALMSNPESVIVNSVGHVGVEGRGKANVALKSSRQGCTSV